MSYRVITHNGKAHMDEVLGIALLSIHKGELPCEITRVHPEEAARLIKSGNTSDDVYYVDCGLKYDTSLNVFDHHHSNDIGCSALLIFEYFFNNMMNTSLHKYIQLVSKVDTMGPNALNDFAYKSETVDYFGFTQNLLLRQFEINSNKIVEIFRDGILSIIDFETIKDEAINWLKNSNNTKIIRIKNINALVYLNAPPVKIASAVKILDSDIINDNNIHLTYSFDKDDDRVRTLYRTLNGDKLLNFNKSTVSSRIFCHTGGFLLKFIPKNPTEWKTIIEEALIV